MNKSPWVELWQNPQLLWSKVDQNSKTECWPWRGHLSRDGYGKHTIKGVSFLAHRAAFFLGHGYMYLNDCVMHSCDNPRCCNPNHLRLGTHADNMADMKNKGRRKRINTGVANGRARLTFESVRQIRERRENGASLKELAAAYCVGLSTISRVCLRRNWL